MGVGSPEAERLETKTASTRSMSYLALILTLIVALMYLFQALRGHPMQWPSTALLIALCATSVSGFMQSQGVKRALTGVGLIFALAAIYGFIVH